MTDMLDLDDVEWELENEESDEDEIEFSHRLDEALEKEKEKLRVSLAQDDSNLASESKVALENKIDETRRAKEARERKRKARIERRRLLQIKVNNLKATLLGRIAICLNLNQACFSLSSIVNGFIPENVREALQRKTVDGVQYFISWVRKSYRRSTATNRTLKMFDDNFLVSNEGSECAIVQFTAACARSFGIPTRVIVRFTQSEEFKDSDIWLEFYLQSNSGNSEQWYRGFASVLRVIEAEEEERAWEQSRTVDPMRRKTKHGLIDPAPRRTDDKKSTMCILGFNDGNDVSIVTQRYSSLPYKKNLISRFLEKTLGDWNASIQASLPMYVLKSCSFEAKRDEFSVAFPVETQVPTTLEGFKNSAEFVLGNLLSANQTISEDVKPVTLFRGQAVYFRHEISQLLNEWGWKKLGRRVKPEELERPKKLLPKRTKIDMNVATIPSSSVLRESSITNEGFKNDTEISDSAADETLIDPRRKLYEVSQTDAIDPGEVDEGSGRIPTNEYGNVELFNDSLLPRNGVHLVFENADLACKDLNIPFAAAMIGFEWRDGRTRPKFNGIVVARSKEGLIRERANQITEQKRLDEEMESRKMRARLWRELLEANWLIIQSSLGDSVQATAISATPRATPHESSTASDASTVMVSQLANDSYIAAELNRLSKKSKVELCDEHSFVDGVCIRCGRDEKSVEYI